MMGMLRCSDNQPWHDCMAGADQLDFKSERGLDLIQTDVQSETNCSIVGQHCGYGMISAVLPVQGHRQRQTAGSQAHRQRQTATITGKWTK